MSKKRKPRPSQSQTSASKPQPPRASAGPNAGSQAPGIARAASTLPRVPAAVALVASILAAGVLSVSRIAGIATPGCGPGSGCAAVTAGFWGRIAIPGVPVPVAVSHLGVAYFSALLIVLLLHPSAYKTGTARWLVRLGGLASLFYLAVMAGEKAWCWYCIIAHAGNLAFVLWLELACRGARVSRGAAAGAAPAAKTGASPRWAPMASAGSVFAVLVAGFVAAEWGMTARARDKASADAAASVDRISAGASGVGASAAASAPGLEGRWIMGAQDAPVRLVAFTSYQCAECARIESEIESLVRSRSDVAFTIRHVVYDTACNPHATQTLHPEGCAAVRAAEAAGAVGGPDAFWKMSTWLFSRGGRFTPDDLSRNLAALGLDTLAFNAAIGSRAVAEAIKADSDAMMAFGVGQTPTIFVNGIELKGWSATGAIVRAVDAAAKAPRAAPAVPVSPLEKFIQEWRDEPMAALPAPRHWLGPADARVVFVVAGDYQVQGTQLADSLLRALLGTRSDMRYGFMHFPADTRCNPNVPRNASPLGCRMARAAEGAGLLGGPEAFWATQAWILTNRQTYSDAGLRTLAETLKLDAAAFIDRGRSPEADALVKRDIDAVAPLKPPELPTIYLNGKRVPRWNAPGVEPSTLLQRLAEEAAKMHDGP